MNVKNLKKNDVNTCKCCNPLVLYKMGPFRGNCSGIRLTTRETTENPDRNSGKEIIDPDLYLAARLLSSEPSNWDRFS